MKLVRSLERREQKVLAALQEVLRSGNYSEGRYTEAAQSSFARVARKPAVLFNSCGSALYTVFKWLKPLVTSPVAMIQNNTFYASGACAAEAGFIVSLVDSQSDCPSMSVDSLREVWKTTRGQVVVLTHVGGWRAKDYEQIAEFCLQKNLILIEDCAHAVGVPEAGTLGKAACWSFYPTKAVPCGEGGALTTNESSLLDFAKLYRSYGKYEVDQEIRYARGMNLRMSEWDAAVLYVQLEHLQDILSARREDAAVLSQIEVCLLQGPTNWYKYPVRRGSGLRTVGPVYKRSDQLSSSLTSYGPEIVSSLHSSQWWADSHECLPIGEGLYEGLSVDEVKNLLSVQ